MEYQNNQFEQTSQSGSGINTPSTQATRYTTGGEHHHRHHHHHSHSSPLRPKSLFTNKLFCAICGVAMTAVLIGLFLLFLHLGQIAEL